MISRINCFFTQPAANSIRNIVTAPFHRLVWFSLLGTWITLILIVKMSSFLKRYANRDIQQAPRRENSIITPQKNKAETSSQDGENISKILDFGWEFGTDYPYFRDNGEEYNEKLPTQTPPNDTDEDAAFAAEVGMWAFTANCQKCRFILSNSWGLFQILTISIQPATSFQTQYRCGWCF